MAANTYFVPNNNIGDANFRAWGSAFGLGLTAGGWVKTSDTGQIDWTTVLAPSAVSQNRGYEMWRSNVGGGVDEIYVKIEYGSTGTGSGRANIWLTFGFATNGAGTIIGASLTTQTACNLTNTTNDQSMNCYSAVGTNYLSFYWFSGTITGFGMYLSIERTRQADGTFNNEWLVCHTTGLGAITSRVMTKVLAYGSNNSPLCQALINPTYAVVGATAGVALQHGQKAGLVNPSINFYGIGAGQFGAAGSDVAVGAYGETHQYKVAHASTSSVPVFCSTPALALLVRYE